MYDWIQFGAQVRTMRHRIGLSQEQLASRCGLSVRTLRDIEHGRTCCLHRSVRRVTDLLGLPAPPEPGTPCVNSGPPGISILGPLVLRVGAADQRLGSMMQRIVLGLLLARPGESISRDQLVDLLWEDQPPASCLNLVQTYVARLRRALAPLGLPDIESVPRGYRLRLPAEFDPALLDVLAFEDMVAEGRRAHGAGDIAEAARLFGSALDLWHGPVLADLCERVRAHPSVVALQRKRVATALEYADVVEVQPAPETAVTRLLAVIRDEPLHELLHARLMLLLAASGQQADALAAYENIRSRLVEDLEVEPGPELRDAHMRLLRQDLPVPVSGRPTAATRAPGGQPSWLGPRGNVPCLVGREIDATHLSNLLRTHRLVTVTGPVGCGKSALALSVAEQHDGEVIVLDLATLSNPEEPALRLGRLLGTDGGTADATVPATVDVLAEPGRLLVLDNAEHLVPAVAALVEDLLGGCPRLTVLVTSRQPLAVSEETTWRLGALPVPVADESTPATELFCQRARQALSSSDLSDKAAIACLARRLDGLPLALELVAAQLRALSMTELRDRLDLVLGLRTASSGRIDAHDRHRCLGAAIDWSYVLVTPVEQRVLAELSVFPGEFGIAAAESVSEQGIGVLPTLVSLVDRSFLEPVECGGASRFRLLRTVREYAASRLAASGAGPAVCARYSAWQHRNPTLKSNSV